MIDKKMSHAQRKEKADFNASIITHLKGNEYVSIESIERICRVLDSGVDDILEFASENDKEMIPKKQSVNAMEAEKYGKEYDRGCCSRLGS